MVSVFILASDPTRTVVDRIAHQLVKGGPQNFAHGIDIFHGGIAFAMFPQADALLTDTQSVGQRRLRETAGTSQSSNILT